MQQAGVPFPHSRPVIGSAACGKRNDVRQPREREPRRTFIGSGASRRSSGPTARAVTSASVRLPRFSARRKIALGCLWAVTLTCSCPGAPDGFAKGYPFVAFQPEMGGGATTQFSATLDLQWTPVVVYDLFFVYAAGYQKGDLDDGRTTSMFAGLALYLPERVRNRLRPVAGERGQAFVEYVLLLTVIAIVVFVAATWTGLGTALDTAVTKIQSTISGVTG